MCNNYANKKDTEKGWYANHWHRDKPFSKNTLKVVFPIEEITKLHGGIEIRNKVNQNKIFKMIANKNEFLIFYPNKCYHKAGNPDFNLSRKQIMFQLNPSFEWKMNINLHKKQNFIVYKNKNQQLAEELNELRNANIDEGIYEDENGDV